MYGKYQYAFVEWYDKGQIKLIANKEDKVIEAWCSFYAMIYSEIQCVQNVYQHAFFILLLLV